MAQDRWVYWTPNGQHPTRADLEKMATNYLGGTGQVWWKNERLFVELPGKPADIFDGVMGSFVRPTLQDRRWFEIYVDIDHISVITRQADNYTKALADFFAAHVAAVCRARLETE